jgi:hypothetical protein
VDEVVFAQKGDMQLLGARALEGLNLKVDSRRKRLIAAGPVVVATAVPPRFGKLVAVPSERPRILAKGKVALNTSFRKRVDSKSAKRSPGGKPKFI